MMTDY